MRQTEESKKVDNNIDTNTVTFLFELQQLRATDRSGWHHIQENPESVAEHTQRAAALAYILAFREDFEHPELAATMLLFHDMHETRTGDDDLVQKRYLKINRLQAATDQTQNLGMMGHTILQMWKEVEDGSTEAGRIAQDADKLEMAFTARELVVRGNQDAQAWIDAVRERLHTESAKTLLELLEKADPRAWWKEMFNGDFTVSREEC